MVLIKCPACNSIIFKKLFAIDEYFVERCKSCHLARLTPMPTLMQLYEHYSSRSEGGNYSLDIAKLRDPSLRFLYEKIKKNVTSQYNSWLDIGCFDGGLLNIAKTDRYTTYGIEMQESAVTVARQIHGYDNIVLSDSFLGYFAEKSMGVVSAISVIEHLLQPEEIFIAANSYLANDGILIIQAPIITSFPGKLLGSYWPCFSAPEHTYYFSDAAMKLMANNNEFRVIKTYSHIKKLPLSYGFNQLKYFGKKLYNITSWLRKTLPGNITVPVYIGEKIFIFKKI